MRDEKHGFRTKHITYLQAACFVKRITRDFGEKRLIGAVFLDVVNAFHTVMMASSTSYRF